MPPSANLLNDAQNSDQSPDADSSDSEIEIFHFNDVYEVEPRDREPLGGVARFIGKIKSFPRSIVFFSGDCLAPSLLSTVTKGEHMVKFLNMMGISAACIGNHDFDFGAEHLSKESNFPWLMSNALDRRTGQRLGGGAEFAVVESPPGIGGARRHRIGVLGLIEEEWLATLATLTACDVTFEDPVLVARRLSARLRAEESVDAVVALTHMRLPNDRRLAEQVVAEVVHGVPILKSGSDFRQFTRVFLRFPAAAAAGGGACAATGPAGKETAAGGNRRLACRWEAGEVCGADAEDPAAAALVEECRATLALSMSAPLGELGCAMDAAFAHIRTRETNAGNWIADTVRDAVAAAVAAVAAGRADQAAGPAAAAAAAAEARVDAALLNSGTLRADDVFPPGPFLARDLAVLLPMLDELVVLSLSGEQLLAALENGVSQHPRREGRFPLVSGLHFAFDGRRPAGRRVDHQAVWVAGRRLDPAAEYRVVTKAYMATGRDGYDVLAQAPVVWSSEALPTIPDTVRRLFTGIAELNARSTSPPPPAPAPPAAAAALSAAATDEDAALWSLAAASSPSRRLSRSLHVSRDMSDDYVLTNAKADASVPPSSKSPPSLPSGGGRRPVLMHKPSTAELEDLLHEGWDDAAAASGGCGSDARPPSPRRRRPAARFCGRYKVFAQVDGRITCMGSVDESA